jgi:hypothetical protein
MATVTTTLRLPEDLHKALQELADSQERSLTGQIVYMLRKQLEEENKKASTTH